MEIFTYSLYILVYKGFTYGGSIIAPYTIALRIDVLYTEALYIKTLRIALYTEALRTEALYMEALRIEALYIITLCTALHTEALYPLTR